MFQIVMVSETLPAERQGTNLILSVHQGIPIPEFLSSYEARAVGSVMRHKSLSFDCHSGLDPESSISKLDSCFRRNDIFEINVKKC
jgi:hypothetical protein